MMNNNRTLREHAPETLTCDQKNMAVSGATLQTPPGPIDPRQNQHFLDPTTTALPRVQVAPFISPGLSLSRDEKRKILLLVCASVFAFFFIFFILYLFLFIGSWLYYSMSVSTLNSRLSTEVTTRSWIHFQTGG